VIITLLPGLLMVKCI